MFWAYNTASPQIDIILCKEDLTLQELLDQENVLQELKAQNLKLIEFLLKPEILRELVSLIITEPNAEIDETEQYKYPNLACELLTSDLPALNERLASEEILNKMYCFLQNDPPLNPLLSAYFSRTLSILISRKSEQNWYSYQYTCLQALEFLKAKEEFIKLLLKHMGTSSIMDLMHNLVTLVEGPELKQSLRNWLQSQNVIPNLISLLSPLANTDCQANAASVLCSIIQKLRENVADLNEKPESDPILNLLESSPTIALILNTVFDCDTMSETSIESAIDVLLTLIQPHLPGDARCRQVLSYTVHDKMDSGLTIHNSFSETEQVKNDDSVALYDFIAGILPYMNKLKLILQNPIKTDPIKLTSGVISPPFGKSRLLVAKFIVILISLNNAEINKEIIHCDIPELLLDLFYVYSSNNFLHTEVEKLIAYAVDNMNGYPVTECNDDLFLTYLLKKCNLMQRILNMWKENSAREQENLYRRGYMGHLIRIASIIHIEDEKKSSFHELLQKELSASCLEEWNSFVVDELKSIIEKHTSCLGGIRPKSCQSSDNSFDEAAYKEIKSNNMRDYDQEDDQNVMFSTDPSIAPYGSNNDISDEEQEQKFHAVCATKWESFNNGLNRLDDDDENEQFNEWKEEIRSGYGMQSWDSDDENADEDTEFTLDPWSKLGNTSDPWASSSNDSDDVKWKDSSDSGWAKFDTDFGSLNKDQSNEEESCSTLATNLDSYSLFGNSNNGKTNLLNNFSNVKISNDRFDSSPFEDGPTMVNGDWSPTDENAKVESQNNSFKMQNEYTCFAEHGKDSSDEMLNLASICGNTLAEKIANAENDIRYKFEEQRSLQSNFQIMNEPQDIEEDEECSNRSIGIECDVELTVTNVDEFASDEVAQEQMCVSMSPPDCLTENSVDFVTAENSTSDAESSVEFGDAENSLEDDFIGCEKMADYVDDELTSPDSSSDHALSEGNECGDILSENVPKDVASKKCNSSIVESEKDVAELDKSLLLVNGDVADCEKIVNCDKSEDSCDTCNLTKKEVENNSDDAVIKEPA